MTFYDFIVTKIKTLSFKFMETTVILLIYVPLYRIKICNVDLNLINSVLSIIQRQLLYMLCFTL